MHPEKSSIFLGTRFIPLSLEGEGELVKKEGLTPLLDTPLSLRTEGRQTATLSSVAISHNDKGKGIQRDGVMKPKKKEAMC